MDRVVGRVNECCIGRGMSHCGSEDVLWQTRWFLRFQDKDYQPCLLPVLEREQGMWLQLEELNDVVGWR